MMSSPFPEILISRFALAWLVSSALGNLTHFGFVSLGGNTALDGSRNTKLCKGRQGHIVFCILIVIERAAMDRCGSALR
jgi:hypothetical protein